MLILICKCFIALLLLGSLSFTLGFCMIVDSEEEMPKWIIALYLTGILIIIFIL